MSSFSELKRRQIFRVGAAYLLTAWLVIQVVEMVFPAFGFGSDADGAFNWLKAAVAQRDPGLTDVVVEPLFDNLRADPRWGSFLERIGRSPSQLAAIEFEVKVPLGPALAAASGSPAEGI